MRPARTLILSGLLLLTACAGTREMAAPQAPTPAPGLTTSPTPMTHSMTWNLT